MSDAKCLGLRPRPSFWFAFDGFAAKHHQKEISWGWLCHPQTPAGGDVATVMCAFCAIALVVSSCDILVYLIANEFYSGSVRIQMGDFRITVLQGGASSHPRILASSHPRILASSLPFVVFVGAASAACGTDWWAEAHPINGQAGIARSKTHPNITKLQNYLIHSMRTSL